MPSYDSRSTDTALLHPTVRAATAAVLADLGAQNLPFRLFEAFRSPQRQNYLYQKGRTTPGPIVTKAPAWRSYHQYGLAVDLVLFVAGGWSWSTAGEYGPMWDEMNRIGRTHGLEPLSWEKPHLQMAGLGIGDLAKGVYPDGGDETWADNLEGAIASWSGSPAAPPPPESSVNATRPPLPDEPVEEEPAGLIGVNDAPPVGEAPWHNRFGGMPWRYDGGGIYLQSIQGGNVPIRSPGAPVTCRAIWQAFGPIIMVMAKRYGVAPEIIMMTIGAETAAHRPQGFTGPATFRWEGHVVNKDVSPPVKGDYSAGPMQTLGTTARWVIREQHLPYHPFQVAPVFPLRPVPPPDHHPLYDPVVNIEIGTAEIRQRMGITGGDPILVAAAFNAGGLYPSTDNPWHLRSYGNHLDRAAQWFGDACFVLKEAGVRA